MTVRDRMLRLLENVMPSGGVVGASPFGYNVGETDKRPNQYPDMKRRKALKDPMRTSKKKPRQGRARMVGLRVRDFKQPGGPTQAKRPWAYHGESLAERMISFQRGKRGLGTKSGPFGHYPFIGLPKSKEMFKAALKKGRGKAPKKINPDFPIPKDGTDR